MIEALSNYAIAITSRKIDFCSHIKQVLINNNAIISDDYVANAVAKLPNAYFITTIEKNNNKIILENNVIPKLLKQNPTMINEILKYLSN